MAGRRGQVTARSSGGSLAGLVSPGPGWGYSSSRMRRPWAAISERVGASWMEAKAFTCRAWIRASAASTPTTSAAGTITDTSGSLPMTKAAVTENTKTPTASPNVRHTMGSSRNRFSRGDRLEKAHCTTRNSSEKMMLTSPRTPKPTPISVSVTRLLATVGAAVIRGSSRPRPSPATANSSCTRPAAAGGGAGRTARAGGRRTRGSPSASRFPRQFGRAISPPHCFRPAIGQSKSRGASTTNRGPAPAYWGWRQRLHGGGRGPGSSRRSGMTSSSWTWPRTPRSRASN